MYKEVWSPSVKTLPLFSALLFLILAPIKLVILFFCLDFPFIEDMARWAVGGTEIEFPIIHELNTTHHTHTPRQICSKFQTQTPWPKALVSPQSLAQAPRASQMRNMWRPGRRRTDQVQGLIGFPKGSFRFHSNQKVKLAVGVGRKSAGSFPETQTVSVVAGSGPLGSLPSPTNLERLVPLT